MPNFSGVWNLKEQVQAIAAGRWTGIPLNELYAWGNNGSGQLGLNTVTNMSSPTQVGELTTWSQVSAQPSGSFNMSAIRTDGTMWSWGINTFGRLGVGDTISKSSPTQVGSATDWYLVQPGSQHGLALKTTGTLWAWGRGANGRLGDNTIVDKSSPVQIGALTTWVSLGTASQSSFGIRSDGTLWSWGDNDFGALGQNDTTDTFGHRSSPTQVGGLTNWATVSGGDRFALAVKTDGTLWSWGYGVHGRLANNATSLAASRSSPIQVGALTNWANVRAAAFHGVGVKTDGTLWSWGRNNIGQLGDGTVVDRASPVQIGALTTWDSAAGGGFFSLAVKTDGTLWSWGDNSPNGQLGDGTVVDKSSPVQVGSLTNWSQVTATYTSAAAILQGTTN